MIQKIVRSGDEKLRIISKPVKRFDKKIKNLITDLKDTLKVQNDPEGIGLAAPQIGINLRVFVTSYKTFKRVVVNPEIVEIKNKIKRKKKQIKKSEILEGCLSLPNYYGPLKREPYLKLKYLNENGNEVVEEFRGFNAQIILHEIDHLNGILFVDRLLEQKKKLYKLDSNNEWEEVELI